MLVLLASIPAWAFLAQADKVDKELSAAKSFAHPRASIYSGKAKRDNLISSYAGNSRCPGSVQGEALVKFKKGVSMKDVNSLAASLAALVDKHYRAISRIHGQEYVHLVSSTMTTEEMIAALEKHPDVDAASPNYRIKTDMTIPNDAQFGELWGLHNTGQNGGTADVDIDAPEAWDKNTGSSNVIVAVIDTGINYAHTDLAANTWVNPGEIPGNSVDDDGNEYIDDIHGINAITGSGDPMDDHSHGTHCAGTIGAVGNNSLGVAGVNWNVKILGAKFLDASGSGYTSDAIACIDYVIAMKTTYGQNIVAINASWGGDWYDQSLKDAIDAAGAAGIVFCAAAGNWYEDNDIYPHYPSSYDCSNIIAVTGVDRYGNQHFNYGVTSVDLGAPAVDILSTVLCEYTPQSGDIFFDDMESGSGNWVTGGTHNTWAITTDQEEFENPYFPVPSPTGFWSDSPGTDYVSNTDSWLMNASDIDLSAYVGQNVYLGCGSAMYIEEFYDHAYVEVSGDSGASWTPLMDFSGYGYYWQTGYTYIIPDAVKTADFRFRFHLLSDCKYEDWGWLIDDVGIGTNINCSYDTYSGTSMAAPHVTGAVAMLAARYPSLPANQIITMILNHTTPLASLSGLCVTGGMLNLDFDLGALTIASPNGGENWPHGSMQNITWTASGVSGNLKITLWKDGVCVGTIADNVSAGLNSYPWKVGQYIGGVAPVGIGYTIRIKEKDSPVSDDSDAAFSIVGIRVISPNGSENWVHGWSENISWETCGVSGNLRISLWKDGVSVGIIADDLAPGSSPFPWTVGQYIGGTIPAAAGYTIRIREKTSSFCDYSDKSFTIYTNPFIMVNLPNGGESWQWGTAKNITWTTAGIPGNLRISLYKSGVSVGIIADDLAPLPGSYTWKVGQLTTSTASPGTGYSIKIREKGTTMADMSNGSFEVTSAPDWTFMVYLDGDNNLEGAGIEDFLQMASVGSTAKVNIVVQFDRISGEDSSYGDWTGTKRFHITPGMTPNAANALMDIGEANMGDPATLIDFVNWAKSNYPAQKYALVMWNHGGGWRKSKEDEWRDRDKKKKLIVKAVCWDDTNGGDCLYMSEVKSALSSTGGAQLIGFDACLMGMTEVAYEIKDHGQAMVGSEETEPWYGWPYDTIIGDLTANSFWTASQLGSAIVDRYYASYGNDETQAAVDLTKLDTLAGTIGTFAQSMIDNWDTNENAVKSAAQDVMTKIDDAIINEKHGSGWPGAHGMAIYFPAESYNFDPDYNGTIIDFPNNTQWEEFLQEFYSSMTGSWIEEKRLASQEFYYPQHIDLYHFCELLNMTPGNYYNESQIDNAFAGGGAAQGLFTDDYYITYTFPFDFPYFGEMIPAGSSIYISSNGFVDFDASSDHSDPGNSITSLAANKRIAVLWADLYTAGSAQAGEDVYITENTDNIVIRWAAETLWTAEPVNFELELHQDGRIQFNYGGGNTVYGYNPTIGISKGDSVNYYLSVYDGVQTLTNVASDVFTPLAPAITVTAPNGGENWTIGTGQYITWNTSGNIGLVKITLWKDGVLLGMIADDWAGVQGYYPWTLGSYSGGTAPAGTGYTVKIKSKISTAADTSDGSFTLNNP